MLEKEIEEKLRMEVKKRKGMCLKFVSLGNIGVPDRIVLFHDGNIGFVEVKAPKKKPRRIQLKMHKILKELGFKVYILDDKEKIKEILNDIQST